MKTTNGRPRWLRRRGLYTGGALMVLAPVGAGCEIAKDADAVTISPADVVADVPDGYVNPDVIAIAPFDPGKVDIAIAPDLNGDFGKDPAGGDTVIAIAPADVGKEDPGTPDMIAIAPADLGSQDVPPDANPGDNVIAIVPPDFGPGDVGPDAIAIAPYDAGPDGVQPGSPCLAENIWCSDDLMCRATAICALPTDCCGGCECQPVACQVASDNCPDGRTCVPTTDGSVKGTCQLVPVTPGLAGFLENCKTDADCLQEYFCQQLILCIAPAPDSGGIPDGATCGQPQCAPQPCAADGSCAEGSTCVPVGTNKLCVRGPVDGTGLLGKHCGTDADCNSKQYFCVDTCPGMCIVAVFACEPQPCDPAKPACPPGASCQDVGYGDACVKP